MDTEPWKSFFGGRNNTDGRFDHWSYNRAANDGGNTLPLIADAELVVREVKLLAHAEG